MDPEGAELAINSLHGKPMAKFNRPMLVEVSQVSHAPLSQCACSYNMAIYD